MTNKTNGYILTTFLIGLVVGIFLGKVVF